MLWSSLLPSAWRRAALTLAGLLAALAAPAAGAQPTNQEALEALAVGCLADVPDGLDAFRLDVPAATPYLQTALVARWSAPGRAVYVADSTATSALPTLSVAVDEAAVTYARAGRGAYDRTVRLAVRHALTAPDGRILSAEACSDAYTDTIARSQVARLESPTYPETQGAQPQAGWVRRYAQPAVLATAVVVTVYLFFSLRSDRADDVP